MFHIKCVPLTEEPDDDWICPCCAVRGLLFLDIWVSSHLKMLFISLIFMRNRNGVISHLSFCGLFRHLDQIIDLMPLFQHLEECKKLGDRSKCCRTNLAKMLPFALDRMSSSGTEAFQQPVTTDVAPNYFDFVHYPMDMGTLRQVSFC